MVQLSRIELFTIVLILYAYFGKLIYGGVYWGRIKYWDEGIGLTGEILVVSLLLWVFQLCLPFGGFVMNCILIHCLKPSKCNKEALAQFPNQTITKIAQKYPEVITNQELYIEQRCTQSYPLFISFLVAYLVGYVLFFFYSKIHQKLLSKGKKMVSTNEENPEKDPLISTEENQEKDPLISTEEKPEKVPLNSSEEKEENGPLITESLEQP